MSDKTKAAIAAREAAKAPKEVMARPLPGQVGFPGERQFVNVPAAAKKATKKAATPAADWVSYVDYEAGSG